jgi:hypothetical protein
MANFDDIFNSQDQGNLDKEAFAARKKQERDAVYALVDETVSNMAGNGEAFQTYLDVQSRFDRYSATNAILICAQKPDATKLADFDTWKESGTFIKRGAEAITILEPGKEFIREEDGSTGVFYNPKKVFDISQTTARRQKSTPIHYDKRMLLKALIGHAPCRFAISPELPENVNVRYQREQNTIFVRPALDGDTYFRGVSQELARAHMERSGKEYVEPAFTAYCVSYMVCKRNGVAVDTFRFDQLPEAYRSMEPQALREELGKMKELSGDMIAEMRRGLEAHEKSQKSRDDGAR